MFKLKSLFRPAKYDDFNRLQCRRIADSSYKNIAFPLGCSHSEFQMSCDDREIALLDRKKNLIGFVRVKSIMSSHIYLDYFCIQDTNACAKSLTELQNHLLHSYKVKKFFIQLLEGEKLEQQTLEENQFKREASLSQHIWLNGAYKDVYIYGSPLYV